MRQWYKNSVVLVSCHLIGWAVFFAIPGLLGPDFQRIGIPLARPPFFTAESLVMEGSLVGLFYFNAYCLIPRFLNRKKISRYLLFQFIILTSTFFTIFSVNRMQESFSRLPLVFSMLTVSFVLAVSTSYRFILEKLRRESLEELRHNERLTTELIFLRSQISPHFIFNILNSAVSLARIGSDQLEPTLIKLSNLLRYMLYNADDDKVPLAQEVEYLESYIDLQKMRFEKDVSINFNRIGVFLGYGIEPMLLIPLVENAFKHGIGSIDKPAIFIDLKEEDGTLHFHVKNRFNPSMYEVQDKNSGIGLANVKKRLKLLYDDKYSLDMNVINEWFDVNLNLSLK